MTHPTQAQIIRLADQHYADETPRRLAIIAQARAGDASAMRYVEMLLKADGFLTAPVLTRSKRAAALRQRGEL